MSTAWIVASVLIFTAVELGIALVIAPAILVGRLASVMVQYRLDMLMHLGSFYLGGIVVGLISPGVRLLEPAIGAFVSVLLVMLMSVFLPNAWMQLSLTKLLVGGGIACALALMGAYSGERLMGNLNDTDARRQALRDRMWGEQGALSRGDARFVVKPVARYTRS